MGLGQVRLQIRLGMSVTSTCTLSTAKSLACGDRSGSKRQNSRLPRNHLTAQRVSSSRSNLQCRMTSLSRETRPGPSTARTLSPLHDVTGSFKHRSIEEYVQCVHHRYARSRYSLYTEADGQIDVCLHFNYAVHQTLDLFIFRPVGLIDWYLDTFVANLQLHVTANKPIYFTIIIVIFVIDLTPI